jgi:hypothetical protein
MDFYEAEEQVLDEHPKTWDELENMTMDDMNSWWQMNVHGRRMGIYMRKTRRAIAWSLEHMNGASPWHDIRQPLLERCGAVSSRDWFLVRAKNNETKWTVMFKKDADTIVTTAMFPIHCATDVLLLIIRLLFKLAVAVLVFFVFERV